MKQAGNFKDFCKFYSEAKRFASLRSYVYLEITNSPTPEQRTPSTWLIYKCNLPQPRADLNELNELERTILMNFVVVCLCVCSSG